jgi:signal transduction histidine kinase
MGFPKSTEALAKWQLRGRPAWFGVGATTLLVAAALAVTSLLWVIVDRPVSAPLFLAAIVGSAWLFGFRYGILAALLSGLAIDYYFVPPYYHFAGDREEIVRFVVFLFEGVILSWITEKLSAAGEELNTSREELRELTKHLETMRESEQKRIALEIHDELGQALTGVKMRLHLLRNQFGPNGSTRSAAVNEGFEELSGMVDSTISTVRRIASELRPSLLDDFGLVAAMEWQAIEFERKTSIPCIFNSDTESLDLGPESNTAVYRIFQEALTNAARHSGASRVRVDLRTEADEIVMKVSDNGSGIDLDTLSRKRSLGIIGMRERSRLLGGELSIVRDEGGTTIELNIPVTVVDRPGEVLEAV